MLILVIIPPVPRNNTVILLKRLLHAAVSPTYFIPTDASTQFNVFNLTTLCCMLLSCVRLSVIRRYCNQTAKSTITRRKHRIAQGLCFLTPKIATKFQRDTSQWGCQIQVGRLQSAIFDQYLAISQKWCKIET